MKVSTRNTQWLFNNLELTNEDNDIEALITNPDHMYSTHTEVISSDKTDYDLITVGSGKEIEVAGVQISVGGNVGEVCIDFEDGTPVKRLYSSNKTQVASQHVAVHGGDGNNLQLTGSGGTADIFVAINYMIESV